jgi:hypothetical protein
MTKVSAGGGTVFSVDIRDITSSPVAYPNHLAIDLDHNIWVTFNDVADTKLYNGTTGVLIKSFDLTQGDVIVINKDAISAYVYSPDRIILHEINIPSKTLTRTIDITEHIDYLEDAYATQIAYSLNGYLYLPVMVKGPGDSYPIGKIARFDPDGDGAFTVMDIQTEMNIVGVAANDTDMIYAFTMDGDVIVYNENTAQVDSIYRVDINGVITTIEFDESGNLYVYDDGSFGEQNAKQTVIDVTNGSVLVEYVYTTMQMYVGDPNGYQLLKIVGADVTPEADPTIDDIKVRGTTSSGATNGIISIVGLPGCLTNTNIIKIKKDAAYLTETLVPNADGSFTYKTAPGVGNPAGDNITIEVINVTKEASHAFTTSTRTSDIDSVEWRIDTVFEKDGQGAMKVLLLDVKRDEDEKYFNGATYVAADGDYMQLTKDAVCDYWEYHATFDSNGQISMFIDDDINNIMSCHNAFVRDRWADKITLDLMDTKLDEILASPDLVFSTPISSFTNNTLMGGYLVNMLTNLDRNMRKVVYRYNSFDVTLDQIKLKNYPQPVQSMTTPNVEVVIYDENYVAMDLTGAEVWMYAKKTLNGYNYTINKKMDIIDAAKGLVSTRLTVSETSDVGTHFAQIKVTIGSVVQKTQTFELEIYESL